MLTKKHKFFLVLFAAITSFVLLEAGLQFGGWIYRSYRIKDEVEQLDNGNTIKILCLGDSWTFGFGAEKGYSYPEQLEKLLNQGNSHKFLKLYNCGFPGNNSSQLFRKLPKLIERYRPHFLIVLMGINDTWNFEESNYFLFYKDKGLNSFFYQLDEVFSRIKIYKFLKKALLNVRNKFILKFPKKVKKNKTISKTYNHNIKTQLITVNLEKKKEADFHIYLGKQYLYKINRNFELAAEEFKKAIEICPKNPTNEEAFFELGEIFFRSDKPKLAIESLRKAIDINPNNVRVHIRLFEVYNLFGMRELAIEEVKEILSLDPDNKTFQRILKIGLPDRIDDELFERLIRYNTMGIIKVAKNKKIKVILQTYPIFRVPDNIMKKIARDCSLPLVDNFSIFMRLQESNNYREKNYFNSEGHCNKNGYRIIAENVYEVLKSEMEGYNENHAYPMSGLGNL